MRRGREGERTNLIRDSDRKKKKEKKKLFSGNTMLDGVLQLNKLSRGLFLS